MRRFHSPTFSCSYLWKGFFFQKLLLPFQINVTMYPFWRCTLFKINVGTISSCIICPIQVEACNFVPGRVGVEGLTKVWFKAIVIDHFFQIAIVHLKNWLRLILVRILKFKLYNITIRDACCKILFRILFRNIIWYQTQNLLILIAPTPLDCLLENVIFHPKSTFLITHYK